LGFSSFLLQAGNAAARGNYFGSVGGRYLGFLGSCLGAMIDEQICTAITCGYSGSSSRPSVSEYLPGRIIGGTWDDPDQYKYRVYKIEKGIMNSDYSEWPGGLNENMGAPVHSDRIPWTGGQVGDQTLFTVYNDMNEDKHLKYMSNKMGAEVQQTIFSFNRTNELENTVFLRFRVINKSVNTWQKTYFAFWCDPDVGYYGDDKVGIDTSLINISDPNSHINLAFAYNSTNYDEIYEDSPPAVGYQMLKGAFFTKPLRSFAYYGSGSGYSDPSWSYEYYHYMNGKEYDNPGTAESEASLFPLSGQNLTGPNDATNWIDEGDGDKRFLLSTGPFDLNPGESKEFVAAIIVARGTDNFNSVDVLKQYAQDVKLKFDNGEIYGGAVENVSSVSLDPDAQNEIFDDKENSGAVFTLSTEPTGGGTLEVASYIEAPPGTENIVHSSIRGVGKYLEVQELGDISFPIYVEIYYTQNDLDEAGVSSENDLDGIHYWSGIESRWIKYDDTGVETVGDGIYEGYVWANLDHLTALRIGTKVDSALQLNTEYQLGLPTHFSLSQNYPNPFNPSTQINYDLPKSEHVKIEVFNTLGQKIRTLVNRQIPAGTHKVTLNATNLPSGIYIYRIQAGKFIDMKKMVLLR